MNYAVPGVRDYIAEIVREVAWRFDHDGINLDFARVDVLLPPGHQWELREHLNDLMRTVRAVLLERARVRGRPYLLSVQIPPDVLSCHYTGIDIETWVREGLVDILILGCRTFDVDVRDFPPPDRGSPREAVSVHRRAPLQRRLFPPLAAAAARRGSELAAPGRRRRVHLQLPRPHAGVGPARRHVPRADGDRLLARLHARAAGVGHAGNAAPHRQGVSLPSGGAAGTS